METTKKLALLSGGPYDKAIQTIDNFPDDLVLWPEDQKRITLAEYLPGTFITGGDRIVAHRYKATGSIFELNGHEMRPYSYAGTR